MATQKYITLKVRDLTLDNLAGLCAQTVTEATAKNNALGTLGQAKLTALTACSTELSTLINKNRASLLTPQLKVIDNKRDLLFDDIKRSVKAAEKSAIADRKTAGEVLMQLVKPFWNIEKEPFVSETQQIKILQTRFGTGGTSAGSYISFADELGLSEVFTLLFDVNDEFGTAYDLRLQEMAIHASPSATSIKDKVVAAYEEFCTVLLQTLESIPSGVLQELFTEVNEIRSKYVSRQPLPLTMEHTTAAPIDIQPYSGKPVTPLPQVFYQSNNDTLELVFTKDYTLTYKNNTEVGEAQVIIHGKGKYTGQYVTTFHIAMNNEQ